MRIAVVGCGPAGAAAAIFLHDAGHDVTVYERFAAPHPIGAGILMQPTGAAVLDALGIGETVLGRASRIHRVYGTTIHGRPILELNYSDWRPGITGFGVHRHSLFDAMWTALAARGITVQTGTTISRPPDDVDLVVGADGSRSLLREAGRAFGVRRARPYPWGALWAVVDDPGHRYQSVLRQFYRSTDAMVGFLPSGRVGDAGPDQVSMFFSVRADHVDALRQAGLATIKRRVHELAGEHAQPVLDQLHDLDQLVWAGYHDVVLRTTHARVGGVDVVLVGDAAHAMSPQLGQGANLALLDAWTLAQCLPVDADLGAGLSAYAARRRKHVRFYSWASRLTTVAFQSNATVLAPPRDALMHPIFRAPWVRGQIIRMMAGLKTGVFDELGAHDLPSSSAANLET